VDPLRTTPAGAQALPEEWYDDDEWHQQVRYVISAQEVREYKALKTVGAREDFITRFWGRRDPTPATARNEFHEEFDRRVDYANSHFTDPDDAPHTGVDTERGRVYVLFGAPTSVATFPKGAHEIWNYVDVPNVGADVAIEFSVPPIDSCDGSYRVRSPAPAASVTRGHTSVDVYPGGLVTARIAVDFAQVASIAHSVRTARGEQVLEGDGAFWDGQIGPAGKDPLSRHILDCRMFESGGMGFTHPLPSGSYVFSSTVTLLDGVVRREAVPFQVK
jgi:GWxTD domain-containing protein